MASSEHQEFLLCVNFSTTTPQQHHSSTIQPLRMASFRHNASHSCNNIPDADDTLRKRTEAYSVPEIHALPVHRLVIKNVGPEILAFPSFRINAKWKPKESEISTFPVSVAEP